MINCWILTILSKLGENSGRYIWFHFSKELVDSVEMKEHTTKRSSKVNHHINNMPHSLGVMFAWNLPNELDIAIPKVEVVLYKARDINDDRFNMIKNSNFINNEHEVMIFELAIAQNWITPCDQSGTAHTANCHDAKMIKQVLLKPGSYVYLYRVNGSFQLGQDDKLTVLATKRKVHYVDVRRENTVSYEQGIFLFLSQLLFAV